MPFVLSVTAALACDCYGPQSYCGVQAPPPPQWEYTPPDHNILGVKLGEVSYGMDVLVLQSFSGTIAAGDTIRVWGDCGWLCRRFVDTWADGDTVVWGVHDVDLLGNVDCPGGSNEQANEYMITICGHNWLSYSNGIVTGPITSESTQSMTLQEFQTALSGCLDFTAAIREPGHSGLITWNAANNQLTWKGANAPDRLDVLDAAGRVVLSRTWRGETITLKGIASEVLFVRVRHAGDMLHERIVVR